MRLITDFGCHLTEMYIVIVLVVVLLLVMFLFAKNAAFSFIYHARLARPFENRNYHSRDDM